MRVEVSDLKCRSLSKSCQRQSKLFGRRDQGRGAHRVVNPMGQVAVGKQVQAEHRSQVRERPVGLREVGQPLQQQQRDQGCPNLDAEGVFTGADEGLDGQVLLEGLEEQLGLVPIFETDS
jgi:hypothetical protein